MKSDFICHRKHLFRDSIWSFRQFYIYIFFQIYYNKSNNFNNINNYISNRNPKQLVTVTQQGLAKYTINLNWSIEISWKSSNSDPSFGFMINSKIKWFHARPKTIEMLRTAIKKHITSTDFQIFYKIGSYIAKGQNSYCYEFIQNSNDKLNYVAKVIKREQIGDINQLYNELNILKILNYSGLPKFVEFFKTNNTFYIVMEKIEGNKLSTYNSTNKQQLSLLQIQQIILECLKILQYLAQIQVIHRDIQPDNIIYDQKLQNASVKLIDFAKATIVGTDQKLLGTPGYIAPEILKDNKYSTDSDMFSLGCVFYKLLVKQDLFQGVTREETLKENQRCLFNLKNLQLIRIPQSAQHLLIQMLSLDPKQRIKPIEAINHHFFKESMDNNSSPKFSTRNLSLSRSIGNLDAILTSPTQTQQNLLDQQILIDYFQNELPPINQVPVMKQIKGGYNFNHSSDTDIRENLQFYCTQQKNNDEKILK